MDTISTDMAGNYTLKFIPMGAGARFFLYYKDYDLSKHGLVAYYTGVSNEIEPGKTNTIDFKVKKLVNLKMHLVNTSNQNCSSFSLSSDCNCMGFSRSGQEIIVDTVLNFKVPRFTTLQIVSRFYDLSSRTKEVKFTKNFTVSNSDTALTIINP